MMITLLAFFLSHNALAGDIVCQPIALIEPQVNYCDENSAFVAPAQTCRDAFKVVLKKKNEEIAATFAKVAKSGKTNAQSGDLRANEAVLASAEATLDDLIDRGVEIFDEVNDYQDDFVLPVYDAYPEDFKVDAHSKAGKELFRGKECYGEPMGDLDAVKTDLTSMIQQLQKTREEAKKLHVLTKTNDTNLKGTAGPGASGTNGNGGPGKATGGSSANPPSSITGVGQQEKKDADGQQKTSVPSDQ